MSERFTAADQSHQTLKTNNPETRTETKSNIHSIIVLKKKQKLKTFKLKARKKFEYESELNDLKLTFGENIFISRESPQPILEKKGIF